MKKIIDSFKRRWKRGLIETRIACPSFWRTEDKDKLLLLLQEQGRVMEPSIEKLDACMKIAAARYKGEIVAMAVLKPRCRRPFNPMRANAKELKDEVRYELAYFYTKPAYRGLGIASRLAEGLLKDHGILLSASTSLSFSNPMRKILDKLGFVQVGRPYKGVVCSDYLGLFIRFV